MHLLIKSKVFDLVFILTAGFAKESDSHAN